MNKIDRLGRLGIPQSLRLKYGINNGGEIVDILDNENGILIKPRNNSYVLNEQDMATLRSLYLMLSNSGLIDCEYDLFLSRITKMSESVCSKCGNKLFLNNDNNLKCYNENCK